jgi:hypothetical protein
MYKFIVLYKFIYFYTYSLFKIITIIIYMELVMSGGQIVAFAGAVGADLIFSAVRTTSTSIIQGINYVYLTDKTGIIAIKQILDQLDIKSKITVINTFINELSEMHNLSQSITSALVAVESVLRSIEKEITTINTIIDEHNDKWFASYRSLDYSKHVYLIQHYNHIFDIRIDLLMKLLQVHKYK